MGTQVIIVETGTGSPQVVANLMFPSDYHPAKGELLQLNHAWYAISGYVEISQEGQPTIISMTVFAVRKIEDGTD